MACLWNLSLRSSSCEEIRREMIQEDILPALQTLGSRNLAAAQITDSESTNEEDCNPNPANLAVVSIDDPATMELAEKLHTYLQKYL